jgi:hypothetical protein
MTGYELQKELQSSQEKGRCFIKWWRKENDFVDYELIDAFLEHLSPDHEFGGYELLDTDQMWRELKRREPKRVTFGKRRGEPVIRWQHQTQDGHLREDIYPYSPKVIMAIFDRETHGDTLC